MMQLLFTDSINVWVVVVVVVWRVSTAGQTQTGLILLLPQTAALPESDAGSGVIKPASSFVIQSCQISCSMWCPMYRTRC